MDDTITVVGNVATDPHDRSQGASPVVSFRLASTPRRYDRERNAWVDAHTNWFTVSAFRSLGAHVLTSVRKGQRVIVTGKLRVRDYQNGDKSGTAVDIDAEAVGLDLRFGTAVFSGAASSSRSSREWDVASVPELGEEEDAWAAPMDGGSAHPLVATPPTAASVDAPF